MGTPLRQRIPQTAIVPIHGAARHPFVASGSTASAERPRRRTAPGPFRSWTPRYDAADAITFHVAGGGEPEPPHAGLEAVHAHS